MDVYECTCVLQSLCEYALREKMKLIFIAVEEGGKNMVGRKEEKKKTKQNSDQIVR